MSLVPFKPKRPCSHTGCLELTEKRFCPEHARAEDTRYRKYQRNLCKPCHSRQSALDGDQWKQQPRVFTSGAY